MTEKVLARTCLQDEGITKIVSAVVAPRTYQAYSTFFNNLKEMENQEKLRQIEKKMSNYDFRWELFMTKCRLGLANNTTKIGHLEQILGFAFL